jgi:hypothetical protein
MVNKNLLFGIPDFVSDYNYLLNRVGWQKVIRKKNENSGCWMLDAGCWMLDT